MFRLNSIERREALFLQELGWVVRGATSYVVVSVYSSSSEVLNHLHPEPALFWRG